MLEDQTSLDFEENTTIDDGWAVNPYPPVQQIDYNKQWALMQAFQYAHLAPAGTNIFQFADEIYEYIRT
jgi:hypothetical protein